MWIQEGAGRARLPRMQPTLTMSEALVGDVREIRFSFELAGERVPGLLCLPRDPQEQMPLVFLQHPGFGSKDDYFVRDVAMRWATRGWACAGLDAPFHGDRRSHDPMSMLRDTERFPAIRTQFAAELATAVDLVAETFPVDISRLGFVGYSLGSMLGLPAVSADGRFRAAAFCLVGEGGLVGRVADGDLDVSGLPRTAIRMVAKLQDQFITREATLALFDSLPGRKDLRWLPGTHFEIGPDVIHAAEEWLTAEL